MRRWFDNFLYKLSRFMIGRYGNDELNRFLLAVAFVLIILSFALRAALISDIATILIIWTIFRSLSKNHYARRTERNKFISLKIRFLSKFSLINEVWKNRKTHKYFRCKKCKAVLRVPKGRGSITVTCRKCQHKMNKKS